MMLKKKKVAGQTGLDSFSPAVLPFLHFLPGHKKSCSYEAQQSNGALTQSDKDHSVAAGRRTYSGGAGGGAGSVHLFPEWRYDGERHRAPKGLPFTCPT